jgi:hypothetical protein
VLNHPWKGVGLRLVDRCRVGRYVQQSNKEGRNGSDTQANGRWVHAGRAYSRHGSRLRKDGGCLPSDPSPLRATFRPSQAEGAVPSKNAALPRTSLSAGVRLRARSTGMQLAPLKASPAVALGDQLLRVPPHHPHVRLSISSRLPAVCATSTPQSRGPRVPVAQQDRLPAGHRRTCWLARVHFDRVRGAPRRRPLLASCCRNGPGRRRSA